LQALRARSRGQATDVTLEFSGSVDATYSYAPPAKNSPARLRLEMDGAEPGGNLNPDLTLKNGPVSRIRTSRIPGGGTRVVLDLTATRQYAISLLRNPFRILVQCSRKEDLKGGTVCSSARVFGIVGGSAFVPEITPSPGSLVEQLGLTVRTIMIDPGHGGKDPGAMGNGLRESALTLRMARLVGQMLQKKGFTVLYTRTSDRFISLEQRTALANDKKADLFVSLHVNANNDKNVSGLETYFLDLARSSSAAHVAARENAVSVKGISDLQFILTDLMLNAKLQESREMANFVHDRFVARVTKAGFTPKDNGVRSAPFFVLMGARMPAILVELGYLSNDDDAARLKSPKFQERIAEGIVEGIQEYKAKLDRFAAR
jgi:N-acetylmuramoyl-L-alanine amidase